MQGMLDPKFLKRINGTMVCLTCAILRHSLRALQTGVYKKPPNFNPEASPSSGILSGCDTSSPVTRDHVRGVVISSSWPWLYPLWLASPLLSGSPRRVTPLVLLPLPRFTLRSHPVVVMVFLGIALPPWMFLKSAARQILGTVRPRPDRPCSPLGFGVQYVFSLGLPAIVVLSFRSIGPGP